MTPEELVEASVAGIVARAKELGSPISDEDLAAVKGFIHSESSRSPPTSKAEFDEKMGQMNAMPLEALQQMLGMVKMMAGMGAAAADANPYTAADDAPFVPPTEEMGSMDFMSGDIAAEEPWSITAEELVEASVAGIVARAKELGSPISDEDLAGLKGFMAGAGADLPTSKAEYDEKMGQMNAMPLEALQQMLGMVKMMAGMGAAAADANPYTAADDAPFVPPTEEMGSMDFMSGDM